MTNGLPPGWLLSELGEFVSIKYGKNLPTRELEETGYPVFGANGVIGYHSSYLYEQEQVLISCRGANSGTINISPPYSFITNNSLVLELPPKLEDTKKYIFYALQQADKSSIVTGSAQPQVTINNAAPLKIPFAPLAEQHRIVEKLEELFTKLEAGVDALKKTQTLLGKYRQAVLKAAVTGELSREWRAQHPDVEPASELLERILVKRYEKWEADETAKMLAKEKMPKGDKWKARYKEPTLPDISEVPQLAQIPDT